MRKVVTTFLAVIMVMTLVPMATLAVDGDKDISSTEGLLNAVEENMDESSADDTSNYAEKGVDEGGTEDLPSGEEGDADEGGAEDLTNADAGVPASEDDTGTIQINSEVTAKANMAYTIVITPNIDFGTIDRSMGTQTKPFVVKVENALIEDGASIIVKNITTDMVMRDKDGTGNNTLDFTLEQSVFEFTQDDLADGTETITSSVSCNPSELKAAGSYKGCMTFEVSCK